MAKLFHEKFIIPPTFDLQSLPNRGDKLVVVSIIGKSSYNVHHSKAAAFNPVIDSDVFQGSLHDENSNWADVKNTCSIEGHYDAENRVVYLHLRSVYDASSMVNFCKVAAQDIAQMGYQNFWQTAEHRHARALLYLFSVSHAVVLFHPGNSFDIGYVRLFRILELIRQKLLPSMTEVLREMPVSKEWMLAGRPCAPRVLFAFQGCTVDPGPIDVELQHSTSRSRNQKTPPIRRLQHAIEDQIYRILRKSRVITNISNNSLFAVPANQEFVYVYSKSSETDDPVDSYLTQLRNHCMASMQSGSMRNLIYQNNTESKNTNDSSSTNCGEPYSFRQFLLQHIELAHTKGFDDNVGRNPIPSVFELPTTETWFKVCAHMYDFFMVDHMDTKARPPFNTLKSLLEIDTRFSESRCAKVLPLAEGAYQEGLPQHYTKSYHLNKLLQAKRVFAQHARGPACEKYHKQLEENCEKLWRNGRQLCEQISLTGNHCVNELHRLADDPEPEEIHHLPVKAHSSQVKTKAACNCGRKQADRDDPFDHMAANYDFYQKLEQVCCGKSEHYELSIFKPSTTDVKAGGTATFDILSLPTSTTNRQPTRKDSSKTDIVSGLSSLSLALSLGQSGGSDVYSHDATGSCKSADGDETAHETIGIQTDKAKEETAMVVSRLVHQHSTTEYLPGMVHSSNPKGLLPKFSSWSLISLGKSSVYNPQQGLEQPGFLHGSNYLLPWDMVIRADKEKWPSVNETSKKMKARKGYAKDGGEFSLRIYLGMEYECPRGHRFFCSGPDKIFKAPASGLFKDTAHKIMVNDMPLYFPCHCRSSKGYMGQLMRVYLALPEGPIEAHVKPVVQPAPPPCPAFHPGTDNIVLPAATVWVLRLPYVYVGEKSVYGMPNDPQHLNMCRLTKGLFTFVETGLQT